VRAERQTPAEMIGWFFRRMAAIVVGFGVGWLLAGQPLSAGLLLAIAGVVIVFAAVGVTLERVR
jgi:hypothetical protein